MRDEPRKKTTNYYYYSYSFNITGYVRSTRYYNYLRLIAKLGEKIFTRMSGHQERNYIFFCRNTNNNNMTFIAFIQHNILNQKCY